MRIPKSSVFVISDRLPNNEDKTIEKNVAVEGKTLDFDDLLSQAGEFGLYQYALCLATLPFYFFSAFAYLSQIFITEVSPQHWCWIPELENLTVLERRNLAIPADPNSKYGYSQCRSYIANWTDIDTSNLILDPHTETVGCQNGWEFNKSEIPYETISSEFGWVCEKNSYQATAQTIYFMGSIMGGFMIGWISDKFGRVPGTVLANLFGFVAGVATIFSTNFIEFAIARFFVGISYDKCYMMAYLIVVEYIAPEYRTLAANVTFALFFSVAVLSLPWIALACGHWKILCLATSLPLGLALLSPLFLPESPRWMLSRGRVDDALKILSNISRLNKKKINQNLIEDFKSSYTIDEENSKKTITDLLKRPLMRNLLIQLCILYMCVSVIFDCLFRNLGNLSYNFFMSFTYVSCTEFPAVMLLAFTMDITGRKLLFQITSLTIVIFCIVSIFFDGLTSVLCIIVARFSINMSFNVVMQWSAELLPTSVRATAISMVHNSGFVALIFAPYIVYLNTIQYWLPMVLTSVIAALAFVISSNLPETAGKELPKTFEDVEVFVNKRKFFEIPFTKSLKENIKDTKL